MGATAMRRSKSLILEEFSKTIGQVNHRSDTLSGHCGESANLCFSVAVLDASAPKAIAPNRAAAAAC